MLVTIFLLILLLVIGVAAVPLMMGIVPPNPYYGWPTRRSSSKPELWKQVNMFAGRAVVIAAALAAIAIMAYNGTWLRSGFAQLFVVIIALGGALGATFWYDRKLAS
jgi:uncharacterized membrane protein